MRRITRNLIAMNPNGQAPPQNDVVRPQSQPDLTDADMVLRGTLPARDTFARGVQPLVRETSAASTVQPIPRKARILKEQDGALVDITTDPEGLPASVHTARARQDARAACPVVHQRERLMRVGGVDVCRIPGKSPYFFLAGLVVDAHGSPRAYHPDSRKGLDTLSNAGRPGEWKGLATDDKGEPLVQGPHDPAPGYHVSSTALEDPSHPRTSPARYVDSERIPYFALPANLKLDGVKLGDLGAVVNMRTGTVVYAILADHHPLGSGSMALAESLGVPSGPRHGGADDGIAYVVFPHSGTGKPLSPAEIAGEGQCLFEQWGGLAQLEAMLL